MKCKVTEQFLYKHKTTPSVDVYRGSCFIKCRYYSKGAPSHSPSGSTPNSFVTVGAISMIFADSIVFPFSKFLPLIIMGISISSGISLPLFQTARSESRLNKKDKNKNLIFNGNRKRLVWVYCPHKPLLLCSVINIH